MPKKILFIDDNPVDRTLISKLLAKNDFEVVLAEDGLQGFDKAIGEKPHLILVDILLPGMSGIELCKKLKSEESIKDIPVIFYTSLDTPKHLVNYTNYGASEYIQKTASPDELIAAIRAVLAE